MAYFPNGVSGDVLDNQCLDCLHDNEWILCPVYSVQSLFNYDQVEKGQEKLRKALSMLVSDDGICKVRSAFKHNSEQPGPVPCMESLKSWAEKHGIKTR